MHMQSNTYFIQDLFGRHGVCIYRCVCVWLCADLAMPHGVGGVGYNGGSSLLAVVGELGEAAPLAGLDGHLQVRVWVKEHALLQA